MSNEKLSTGYKIILAISIFLIILSLAFWSQILTAPSGPRGSRDTKRESDIRQISLAMEMYRDNNQTYWSGTTAPKAIKNYLNPVPTDPGGGSICDCNDIHGVDYQWIDNTASTSYYCMYACLHNNGYFAASHKGTKKLDEAPTSLDCW